MVTAESAMTMSDWVAWLKVFMTAVGAGLVAGAQTMEPSEAVWIMASAGGLLGAALSEDKSVGSIVLHVALGVVLGIVGGSLAEFLAHLPRPPVACVSAIFGARMTLAVNRQIDSGQVSLVPRWFRRDN